MISVLLLARRLMGLCATTRRRTAGWLVLLYGYNIEVAEAARAAGSFALGDGADIAGADTGEE